MPSLGGGAPSRHLRGGGARQEQFEILSRAGGTSASALPSEGVHALVTHALVTHAPFFSFL